jgi:histidinol-phosphatase
MATNSKLLSVALEAAKAAETEILKVYSGEIAVEFKADQTPVTVADQRAEEVIRDTILKAFPDHGFLGEEYGSTNSAAEYVWVIDPIDGTKSFSRHLPLFGTEIAVLHGDQLILGVSHLPLLKQTSWAEKGQGAFTNGKQVHVSQKSLVSESFISYANLKYFMQKNYQDSLLKLITDSYVPRGFSDSWVYHFLAKGSIEAIMEAKINLWDIAAAAVIVEEAGGKVTDLEGQPLTRETKTVLATNGLLHEQILKYFKKETTA